MSILVGISGKRRVGKTTAAQELRRIGEDLDIEFNILPLASPLKDQFAEVMGVEREVLNTSKKEQYREQLQNFGNKMRDQDPKFWIKKFAKTAKEFKNVICDDVRYLNELQYFCEKKALIIRVHADDKTRRGRNWFYDPFIDTHISETDLDFSIDTYRKLGHYIYNNKTLDDLNYELTLVLKNYLK